jgi:phage-related protein (TIGR01555 family)
MNTKKLNIAQGEDETRVVQAIDRTACFAPPFTMGAGDRAKSEAHTAKLRAAFDAAIGGLQVIPSLLGSDFVERGFIGYGRLQQLSQDAVMRLMIQTRTDEMVRRWITIKCEDTERGERLDREIERLGIRAKLQQAVMLMGFMGGAYLYVDTGTEKPEEPLDWSAHSAEFGEGVTFRVVDPFFTAPQAFNATNPLAEDFYKPSVILVMGKPVLRSRLIRLVENEPVQMLLPSYNFLGIPQAQLLEDYVRDFRDNREAANRLLKKFSSSTLKMNLSQWLYSSGARSQVERRIANFIRWRNNDGVAVLDKDSEDFAQINTPLAGVDALLSQSLQFVVAVNRTNVVKTLGLSPAGFNTGDSDIKTHNDLIAGLQEKVLREPIQRILQALTLAIWGDAEPVAFDFNALNEDDERTVAETQKIRADVIAVYADRGIITPEEGREAVRQMEQGDLAGVITGDLPDDPASAGGENPFSTLERHDDDADKSGEVL